MCLKSWYNEKCYVAVHVNKDKKPGCFFCGKFVSSTHEHQSKFACFQEMRGTFFHEGNFIAASAQAVN